MRLKGWGAVLLIISILLLFSCKKEEKSNIPPGQESTLHISLTMDGRTNTVVHSTPEEDNTINTLEVFIFRDSEDETDRVLDTYKKFEKDELESLNDLTVQTTTGNKIIYMIANSHINDFTSITDLSAFEQVRSKLSKEALSSFTMTGYIKATLGIKASVEMSLSRLVSCINISQIRTAFGGTPYKGESLTNVKVYLINLQGEKLLNNGCSPVNGLILNHSRNSTEDVKNCIQEGLFYDIVPSAISDGGYSQSHYLYCYENSVSAESNPDSVTKAVIEADLCGKTYYYPININQNGFGYSEENGHFGVKRNTIYSITAIIHRPGSSDPNVPLVLGTLTSNVTVQGWNSTPVSNIIF